MELFDVVAEYDRDNEDSVASAKGQIADNVSHVIIGMANEDLIVDKRKPRAATD